AAVWASKLQTTAIAKLLSFYCGLCFYSLLLSEIQEGLAERVGFEPTLPVKVNTLSKRAPSATRPSLRESPKTHQPGEKRTNSIVRCTEANRNLGPVSAFTSLQGTLTPSIDYVALLLQSLISAKNPSLAASYLRVLRQARPFWPQLAGIAVLSMISAPLALLLPLPVKIAVDSV